MKWKAFFEEVKYQWGIYLIVLKIWIRHILLGGEAKWHRYFWDRLGRLSPEVKEALRDRCLWLQAISEGDVISLENFLKKLKEALPDYRIVFSTHNFGCVTILKNFKTVDAVFYFPWDIEFICQRVLKLINPQILIVLECAPYPMFLRQAKSLGIPTIILSGFYRQIMEEIVKKRMKFAPDIFDCVNFLGMQTQLDARKVISLGVDKDRVKVTGSLKMDLDYALLNENEKKVLREEFNISFEDIVIVAGPTHLGEEKLFLDAYKDILFEFKNTVLIIGQRYVQNIAQLEKIIHKAKLTSIRRSELKTKSRNKEIIVIDNFGELPKLYGLATIVILGGSFFLAVGGGHNVLEPAVHQKPIFFGPQMQCRVEFLEQLKSAWEGLQVKDKNELVNNILYLLHHPDKLKEVGLALSRILQNKEEIISRNVELVKGMLKAR